MRPLIAGLAVALAAAGCTGPDALSLGGAVARISSAKVYLSPTGVDAADGGSRDRPWKTFRYALPRVGPGSTVTLLDGTPYDDTTTGTLNIKCQEMTSNSAAPDALLVSNGAPGMPITVTADHERHVFLAGNGRVPPLTIDGCHDWTISGLHVESRDNADAPDVPADAGSVVVLGSNDEDIDLERLVASHPNRYKHSHVIRVGDGSSHISIEECELYDFHHNALEAWRSSAIVFARNYVNSRDTADIPGAYVSENTTLGDYGVLLEETNQVYVENNVVEDVAVGFGVVGRYMGVTSPLADPITDNHLLGNVVYEPATIGFRVDSRCQGAASCDTVHEVVGTELANDVVVGGAVGVSDGGSLAMDIHELSVIRAARGLELIKEPQNAGLEATSMTTDALVSEFQAVAFHADDAPIRSFDHCAASGGNTPDADFVPVDHVTSTVTAAPNLGGCLAYLPMTSGLKGAGAGMSDVGANVLYRYDELGQLTSTRLWDATTGAFPCGAIITGVNDDAATSCTGANQRLHAGTADCPLP